MTRLRTAIDPDPLEGLMPTWHWRSRSTAMLPTSPLAAFTALREVTLAEMPTVAGQRRVDPRARVLDDLLAQGFVPLAEPDESSIVLGRAGRMWRPAGPAVEPDSFRSPAPFDGSGYARALLLFAARPYAGETVLLSEVRLQTDDPHTLRSLSRQWLVASWARQLTQQELLRAVRERLGVSRYTATLRARVGVGSPLGSSP